MLKLIIKYLKNRIPVKHCVQFFFIKHCVQLFFITDKNLSLVLGLKLVFVTIFFFLKANGSTRQKQTLKNSVRLGQIERLHSKNGAKLFLSIANTNFVRFIGGLLLAMERLHSLEKKCHSQSARQRFCQWDF